MELLENTQKVLSDNERLRLMLEKQKHPFARLEVQRDLLARKCADFEDSQSKMKSEFEQMQQDSKNTIIGLKEQADEQATQAQKEQKAEAVVLQTSKAADEGKLAQMQTVITATAEITRTRARRSQRSAAPPPPVLADEKKIDKNPAMATKVLASKVLGPESLMGALDRGALIGLGVTQVSPKQLQQQQLHKNMQAALEGKNRQEATQKQAEVLLQAGKITGVLLEGLDNSELVTLIDDQVALQSKIQEALAALEISEHQIKQAKATGRMSLAVCFDDDNWEQQARTEAIQWGEKLKAAFPGLSLGDAKPKGPPGDRRIEVELVGWPSLVGWPLLNDAESQAEAFLPSTMAGAFLPSTITGALKDWEERVSSSCGRVYYHNPKIGKSMWTRPSVGWPLLNDAESGASATPKMSHVESPRLIGTYPMPPKTDFLLDASTSAPPMALEVHALTDILTAKPTVMKQISKAPQVLAARVMAPESVALAYEAGLLSSRVGTRARVGLGIAVVRGNDNVLKITRVVPGYGADKSQQVRVGDSLEEIDGQSVTNHDLTAIRRLLVGREGTKCALRISRDNIPFTVYLIREQPADHALPQDSGRGVAQPPSCPLPQPVSWHGEVTSSGAALASSVGGDRGRRSGVEMHREVEGDATVYGVFAQMSSQPSSSAPSIGTDVLRQGESDPHAAGWSRAEWGPASSSSMPLPEPPAPVSIVAPVKQSLMRNAMVELHSLKAAELNGQRGRLVSYNAEEGRWLVAMGDGEFFKLNSANLRLVDVKMASDDAERLLEQRYCGARQEALDAAMAAAAKIGAGGWPGAHPSPGDQRHYGGLRASMVERAFASSVLGEEGDVEEGEA